MANTQLVHTYVCHMGGIWLLVSNDRELTCLSLNGGWEAFWDLFCRGQPICSHRLGIFHLLYLHIGDVLYTERSVACKQVTNEQQHGTVNNSFSTSIDTP